MITALLDDLAIVRDGTVSLPEQIVRAIRDGVSSGLLHPGQPLPSTRNLSAALSISRGSAVAAYDQLTAEGLLVAKPRSGVRVSDAVRALPAATPRAGAGNMPPSATTPPARKRPAKGRQSGRSSDASPVRLELTPGRERRQHLDDPLWRRAWREAATPPGWLTTTSDALGSPQLREAIAEHLRVLRAMPASGAHMVVTSGARDGLALTLRAFTHHLGRTPTVAVESPGFPGLRRTLTGSGAHVVLLGSDGVGPLPSEADPDLILLTPNHQFPYGTPLPSARRGELLEWARDIGAFVVEDDFDSEYRHLGPPLPALWTLSPQRVIHLGTFTSVLGRDVGTGYVIMPPELVDEFASARSELGMNVAPILQRALTLYLSEGGVRRHIARGRRRLVKARAALAEQLAQPGFDRWHDTGHLLVINTDELTARNVQKHCRAAGLGVGLLADGWTHTTDTHGLVLAYGACSPDEATSGLRLVTSTLTRLEGLRTAADD